ncbi:MAG: efflux RND transporter periplasmic adaptor subunit [Candidatus Paceibacterota bacterium]|jgi:HlyD family secretion protein
MFQKIKTYARTHRKTVWFLFLILAVGGYYGYKKMTDTSAEIRYVMAVVAKGTLISSVSGSGQVSASNQIEIKPKVSGDVAGINVKDGQMVKAGNVVARLDATEAQKAVRDAEVNLETAKLSYEELIAPNDALSTLQWQNTLAKAKESKQTAEDNLQKAYDDGFNNVSNAFLELPGIMTGLKETLFNSDNSLGGSIGQQNIDYYGSYAKMYETETNKADQYVAEVKANYQVARESYDANFAVYKNTSRNSDIGDIETLIVQTYETTKKIADTVKSANNLIQYYKDQSALRDVDSKPIADTHLATLSSYTSKTNSYLSSLLNSTNSISTNKNTIINSTRTIAENELSFQKFEAGADALDIRNAKIVITQKQNAVSDAYTTLSYYTLRAPFDGMIAKTNAEKGDAVSGGTSVATLVTAQQIATLSMNEVDVAKIKIGQKATLTFDAVEDLTITGEVTEVDTIGTVTQGVATYNIKIVFDTQDDRIKPGMTASATIVTDVKTDALMVANSAIKTSASGNEYYVEMFDAPLAGGTAAQGAPSLVPPKQVAVTIGISNDTETEILTGLKEGDLVVIRTTTAAQAGANATAVSARSLFGGGRPGG